MTGRSVPLRVMCSTVVVALGMAAHGIGQSSGATSIKTLAVSSSVLATLATRQNQLLLLALWRGKPRWFVGGSQSGAKYSQAGDVVSASLQYGGLNLELVFDGAAKQVMLQGTAHRFADAANVVLIDDVDVAAGPRVVKTAWLDPGVENINPSQGSLGPLFKRLEDIPPFLRCDVPPPQAGARSAVNWVACDALLAR